MSASVADGWSSSGELGPEKHSLAHILRDHGPLPPAIAVDLALDVCDALASAHANGVVHGDLGLHRVRTVWPRRPNDGVDIFQLVSDDTAAHAFRANRAGTLVSPEQRAARTVDARADVWAVGMLLHWMLTGQPPAVDGVVRLQMLPRALVQTIESCIAGDPALRPASVDEIAMVLGSFASCPTERFERLAQRRGIKTGPRPIVRGPDVDSVLGRLEAAAGAAQPPARPASAPPPAPAPPQPKARTAWTAFRPIIRKKTPSTPGESRSPFPAARPVVKVDEEMGVQTLRQPGRPSEAPVSSEPVTPLRLVSNNSVPPSVDPPTQRFEPPTRTFEPPTTVFEGKDASEEEPTIAPTSAHYEAVTEDEAPAPVLDAAYGSGEPPTVAAPSANPLVAAPIVLPPREAPQVTERLPQAPAPAAPSIAPVILSVPPYPAPAYAYMPPSPAFAAPPVPTFAPPPALGSQLVARAERNPWKTFATVCCAAAALAFGLSLWSRLGDNERVHVAAPPPPVATVAAAAAAPPPPVATVPAPVVATVSPSALPNAGASQTAASTTPAPADPAKPAVSAKPRVTRPAATAKPKASASTSSAPAAAPAPAPADDIPSGRD